jgi:tRNA A-37 threonylcarbamoyl transferase component Bud32
VLLLVASLYAAPAASRDHGRGAGRRSPSFRIERDLVDPLRDAVRSIQRSALPELLPETTRSRTPAPPPARPTAAREPTVPVADPEAVVAEPEPAAPSEAAAPAAPVPPPSARASGAQQAVPPVAPAASTSRRALALVALVLAGVGTAVALRLRRRPAPSESVAPRAIEPRLPAPGDASAELVRDRVQAPDAGQRTTRPRLPVGDAVLAARALVAAGAPDLAIARLDEAFAGPALLQIEPDLLEWYASLLSDADRPAEALVVLQALRLRSPGRGIATRIEELRKRANVAPAVVAVAPAPAPRASPFPSAGRYELLAELGRGGMGVVYRARDTRLDRMVALKRLSEHIRDHPRAVSLLLQEARSAARLNHPNIVTVYDVDYDDGAYFITMELMEGQPLNAVLQQRGRLTPKAAAWVGQHAATGLAYAHERRIVHRDVKTANLFVTRERSLKVMDFGLAKMVEEVRRRASLIAGSPSYMAPEQAQGLEVDGRADLYALGVTLFELLTGRLPFEDGDPAHHHQNTPPPDPRERVASIPDPFAELVVRLMAKQPECRPAGAGEVAAQLRDLERDLSARS